MVLMAGENLNSHVILLSCMLKYIGCIYLLSGESLSKSRALVHSRAGGHYHGPVYSAEVTGTSYEHNPRVYLQGCPI